MGQQQILLIVLSVILVGIAIAVGINVFKSFSNQAESDTVASQLNNAAFAAYSHWMKGEDMGGGDKNNAKTVANKGIWMPTFTKITGSVTVTAAAEDSDNICTIAAQTETTGKVGTVTVAKDGSRPIAWTDAS